MKNSNAIAPFHRLAPSLAALVVLAATGHAGLAEPDNLVYGRITLNGQPVTAAHTDVVVEARRTPDGPAIASYRMGEDRRAGDFYKLRLQLEHAAPLVADDAALTGDRLHIVARTAIVASAPASVDVGPRGQITRLDLNDGATDSDGNGLADDWERQYFGQIGVNPNGDADGDGRSNLREFMDGTDPKVANPHKITGVSLKTGQTVELEVVGLAGKTYLIQATDSLATGTWKTVAQQVAPAGGQFTIQHQDSVPRATCYYRSVEQ